MKWKWISNLRHVCCYRKLPDLKAMYYFIIRKVRTPISVKRKIIIICSSIHRSFEFRIVTPVLGNNLFRIITPVHILQRAVIYSMSRQKNSQTTTRANIWFMSFHLYWFTNFIVLGSVMVFLTNWLWFTKYL